MSSDSPPPVLPSPGPSQGAAPAYSWSPAGFLDPQALIEASRVRRRSVPTWPLLFVGFGILAAMSSPDGGPLARVIQVAGPLLLIGFWVGLSIYRGRLAARVLAEARAVAALDELVQLRRWPEAADIAQHLLSRAMALPDRRLSALVSLATLLTRYHRFEDARIVHDYLLAPDDAQFVPDPSTAHAIRVARAMGMLREDHLVDADRAMNELRREVIQARDAVRRGEGHQAAAKVQSAGLVLLDLYRDVKTRHYEEASDAFDKSLPTLREQLGIRVADAWALVAMARDGLGLTDEARVAYANATALSPGVELQRRYPEIAPLAEKYAATPWPAAAPESNRQ